MPRHSHFVHCATLLLTLVTLAVCPLALADEPFDYFSNNWNVIGMKDYKHGTRITPDNQLQLEGKATAQIRFGRELNPLSRNQGKVAMDGWLPIMLITANDGPVRYDFTFWATPLPTVSDWQAAFDWPTEGENYLNWILVKATNTGDNPTEAKVNVEQHKRPGTAPSEFAWSLGAGESAEAAVRVPFAPVKDPAAFDKEDPKLWLKRTADYWRGVMAKSTHIEVPCRKATEALLAAHVCLLIANDHGEVHAGEGFYDTFLIRDGAYHVMELEEAGMLEIARKAMESYLSHQRRDGRFESQSRELDANGQALWALWQFYKITGDRQWLAKVYPQMRRAVDWTMKARRRAPTNSPFAGLLPNAVADGERLLAAGKHHIVGYDFWNLRGLLCTADAARILGKTKEAEELQKEAEDYRAAIDRAWRRTGLAHFPPSWEKRGTHWGNTETLWPMELFPRDDPRVAALVKHVREDFGGGFIEGIIQWRGFIEGVTYRVYPKRVAIHPYMGAYTTMTDLARGRHEDVVEDFYWYLLHSTAAHAFPEGIYYQRREAWANTIPHVTGASNYAIMLRHMLVHEAGDELHLLSAVPDWWLGEGKEICIERAPTHFGLMSMTVRGTKAGVEITLDPPKRETPKRIVLHLPKSRSLVGSLPGVEVVTRSGQKKRWDFPTVVEQYLSTRYFPSLTTGKPVTCSHWHGRGPATLANDGWNVGTGAYWATDVKRDPDAWWQVDLEKPTTVGRVIVVGYYGDKRYYGFTVETSLDGKTWETAADRRDNKAPSTRDGYACRFEPRPVRFLRVTMTNNSANTGRHLVEVMAFSSRTYLKDPISPPGGQRAIFCDRF